MIPFVLTLLSILYVNAALVNPNIFNSPENLKPLGTINPPTTRKVKPTSKPYTNYQIWKVVVQNHQQIRVLNAMENNGDIDIWKQTGVIGDYMEFMISPSKIRQVKQKLQQVRAIYKTLVTNVQARLDATTTPRPVRLLTSDYVNKMNIFYFHKAYHNYDEILTFMKALVDHELCNGLCSLHKFGTTHHGNDLVFLRVSKSPPPKEANLHKGKDVEKFALTFNNYKPAVWIDAAIHPREWIAPASILYLMTHFLVNSEQSELKTSLCEKFDFYFVPILNPDGYNYTHNGHRFWRKNLHTEYDPNCGDQKGVDLNRNFETSWSDKGSNPCSITYPGCNAFSEPESQAVRDFVLGHGKFRVFLTHHSAAKVVLVPRAYKATSEPDDPKGNRVKYGKKATEDMNLVNKKGYRFGTPYGVMDNTTANGCSMDWALDKGKVYYSYTIEEGGREFIKLNGIERFDPPPEYIIASGKEVLAFFKSLMETLYNSDDDCKLYPYLRKCTDL